jgi:hypothetical protein
VQPYYCAPGVRIMFLPRTQTGIEPSEDCRYVFPGRSINLGDAPPSTGEWFDCNWVEVTGQYKNRFPLLRELLATEAS